jgi:hypothetical protein
VLRDAHPFTIHCWVVLPNHMHCVLGLPEGGAGFAVRLRREVRGGGSRRIPVRPTPYLTGGGCIGMQPHVLRWHVAGMPYLACSGMLSNSTPDQPDFMKLRMF